MINLLIRIFFILSSLDYQAGLDLTIYSFHIWLGNKLIFLFCWVSSCTSLLASKCNTSCIGKSNKKIKRRGRGRDVWGRNDKNNNNNSTFIITFLNINIIPSFDIIILRENFK